MDFNRSLLRFFRIASIGLLFLSSGIVLGTTTYILPQQKSQSVVANVLFMLSPLLSYSYTILHLAAIKRANYNANSQSIHGSAILSRLRGVLGLCMICLWAASIAADLCLNKMQWNQKNHDIIIEEARGAFACIALVISCVFWTMVVCIYSCTTNGTSNLENGRLATKCSFTSSAFSRISSMQSLSGLALSIPSLSIFRSADHEKQNSSEPTRGSEVTINEKQSFALPPHPSLRMESSAPSLLPPIPKLPPLLLNYASNFSTLPNRPVSASSAFSQVYQHRQNFQLQEPLLPYHHLKLQPSPCGGSLYSTSSSRSSSSPASQETRKCVPQRHTSYSSSSSSSSRSHRSTSTRSSSVRKSRLSILSTVEEPPEHEHEHEESPYSQEHSIKQERETSANSSTAARALKTNRKTKIKRASMMHVDEDIPPVPKLPDLAKLRSGRVIDPNSEVLETLRSNRSGCAANGLASQGFKARRFVGHFRSYHHHSS